MKVTAMRSKLKELGLPVSGNKSVLVARLAEANLNSDEITNPQEATVSSVCDESSMVSPAQDEQSVDTGGDFSDFKQYVTKELHSLRSVVENLCGTGNLIFGATATLDMLDELKKLRQQVREKDELIRALSEGGTHDPTVSDRPSQQPSTRVPPAWEKVPAARRRTGQPRNSWDPSTIVHTNRFSMLRDESSCDATLPTEPNRDNSGSPVSTPTRSKTPTPCDRRTPNVPPQFFLPSNRTLPIERSAQTSEDSSKLTVVNPYPDRVQGEIVVPGEKLYSEAHLHKVLIVSDSMCGGIRRGELMDDMKKNGMDVDVSIRRYGGGQTHELYRHAQVNIADEMPHGVILVAGTNDLPRRGSRRQLTDEEIANNLLATGQTAREQGVTNIFISSIIIRKGAYYARRINNINILIEEGCRQHGFIFIDNSNIQLHHTDGLHLTNEGSSILKANIIDRLY